MCSRFVVFTALVVLKPGASIFLYGSSDEGIMSAPALLGAIAALCDTRVVCSWGTSTLITSVVSSNKKLRKSCKRLLKDWLHCVEIQSFPVLEGTAHAPIRSKRARESPVASVGNGSFSWTVAPGLFAGGVVDVMTLAMIKCIQHPHENSRNLDYACGSGIIAKWLLQVQPACRVTMCDNDTVALEVAKINIPCAEAVLSDSWDTASKNPAFEECSRAFDNIYSNPPLHRGSAEAPSRCAFVLTLRRAAR
jgi:16S rRNA (guanine1207-N2)-methyltransferase